MIALQVAHVGGRADERERDEVDAELERELEVVEVLLRQRRDRQRHAGQVDALVRLDLAADDDAAARAAAARPPRRASRTRPSSIRTSWPGRAPRRSRPARPAARRRGARSLADDDDLVVRARGRRGSARSPMRSFGPWRSAISASGRPSSACDLADEPRALRACSSCVPCEKLSRTASIPASTSARSRLARRRAGPDRRDDLRPASVRAPSDSSVAVSACARGKRGPARVHRPLAELLLDPQQLVVLRDAVGARRRAGLDLAGADRDGEVGDRRVLGLARAVRDHRRVAVALREPRSPRASRSASRSGSP